jgi:uncharacterized protein
MINLIQNKLDDIVSACKNHHVKTIALFGSAAKNALREDSDIDLLVEFSDDIDVLDYGITTSRCWISFKKFLIGK